MIGFGERLRAAMDQFGPLCVGIDPHESLLAAWGLPDTPAGLREFSLTALEQVSGAAAAVKPQSAFFERHGSAGVAVLEELLQAARELGVLTILDVKRGDIGSTMVGYSEAYLKDSSPLAADAITLSPYLGPETLEPALELAMATGRGIFVLALTSNPEGKGVQHARTNGGSVAGAIVSWAEKMNEAACAEPGREAERSGPVGLVVGATVGDAPQDLGLDLVQSRAVLLAPGIGEQGATHEDLRHTFGEAIPQILASTSRGVLKSGARDLRRSTITLANEISRLANT